MPEGYYSRTDSILNCFVVRVSPVHVTRWIEPKKWIVEKAMHGLNPIMDSMSSMSHAHVVTVVTLRLNSAQGSVDLIKYSFYGY